MDMARIGPGVAGGNNRQTLTDADAEGRTLFKSWCDAAGLEMGVDRMGTMFMTRPGTDPDALPVYVGSHLDTQPTGGKYDGVLGVLSGLEVVRTLNDLGIRTKRSEEHTSELQSLMRISYAVFCLKKKNINKEKKTIKRTKAQKTT